MLIDHDIDIDMINPGTIPRVHVKQGDAMSRNIRINLYANGEPWLIPDGATAVIRYHIHDPEGLTDTQGIFDTLEDGELAYIYGENIFELMPTAAMMATGGLVIMDIMLLYEGRTLSTFNFEMYVDRAPVSGSEVTEQLQNYYRISSLEEINAELDTLRAAIEALGGGEYL